MPVDLVVDHSVMVDHYGTPQALDLNMKLEFERNRERYEFMKWGMQAFDTFGVVPPGFGIVHQVNLEYLARGVHRGKDGVYYPDTLVGTDSHTTMINGIGVVGWGVGGIEAEAAMLGQPVYFLTPDVVGFELTGQLREGVTATDLVLTVTEMLRRHKVVGKFVEFFGDGAASLTLPDRATIANMAPEYGATVGFFPPDDETAAYLGATGRSADEVEAFRNYFVAQDLFGMPRRGEIDYSLELELDLAGVVPSVAGPGRPQDRIALPDLPARFDELLRQAAGEGGYGKAADTLRSRVPVPDGPRLGHGDVLIAAITSCTNTSNPGVMLAAGLLARKAVARGLQVAPHIKTSLAPGSRVVTDYLGRAGLIAPLEALGFRVVAYGCTTCIGNAGPLDPELERVLTGHDLICASVLSGNRNFEARIHPAIKANFLMSPPLVVAFALAGRIGIDFTREPLGSGNDGAPVFLRDIWPTRAEIAAVLGAATDPDTYRQLYADFARGNPLWNDIPTSTGLSYGWAVLDEHHSRRHTESFIRFFLVPGMDHCVGGTGPDQFGGAGGDEFFEIVPVALQFGFGKLRVLALDQTVGALFGFIDQVDQFHHPAFQRRGRIGHARAVDGDAFRLRHARRPEKAELLAQADLDAGGTGEKDARPATPLPPQQLPRPPNPSARRRQRSA